MTPDPWAVLAAAMPAIPSVSAVVWQGGQTRLDVTLGMACLDPGVPAADGQVYDLASLTKVLAGALVAASCSRDLGVLDVPLTHHFPDAPAGVTPRHLLHHDSGLPAVAPLFAGLEPGVVDRRWVLDALAAVQPEAPPGVRSVYSDLGFLWLLRWLEHVGDAPLDTLVAERVAGPLGARLSWGDPTAAATELDPVRGLIRGTVHDPNAAAMGGVSTHAGLFASAREVARVGVAVLDAIAGRPSPLDGPTLRAFATTRGRGSHVLGWDTPTRGGYTSTGSAFPDDAIGHLGFTGTSIWLVPSWDLVAVLLTNRLHPRDERSAIRALRPAFHDAVSATWGRGAGRDRPA